MDGPVWQEYLKWKDELEKRTVLQNLSTKGFVFGPELGVSEFFKACFPSESSRSLTKRMQHAKHVGTLGPFSRKGQVYTMKMSSVPEKFIYNYRGQSFIHKEWFQKYVAETVEYRNLAKKKIKQLK